MDFSRWLASWLKRHPLKVPGDLGTSYTREVISRLPVAAQPAPARRWLWLFPSPAYALASVAAVVLIVAGVVQRPQTQVARQEPREAAILAESPESDDAWIQQTMQLLDELGEATDSEDAASETPQSDEEWLQELETLDQSDLAASS